MTIIKLPLADYSGFSYDSVEAIFELYGPLWQQRVTFKLYNSSFSRGSSEEEIRLAIFIASYLLIISDIRLILSS